MLAIEKIILLVIFLIVLAVVFILIFGVGKPAADKLLLQNDLTQCCGTFRAYDCPSTTSADYFGIICNGRTLEEIRNDLGLTWEQLKAFCKCS